MVVTKIVKLLLSYNLSEKNDSRPVIKVHEKILETVSRYVVSSARELRIGGPFPQGARRFRAVADFGRNARGVVT